MNALANSQLGGTEEVPGRTDAWPQRPVTFGRYTGQESDDERRRIADNPPDILLTNFMMLELLMTRQNDIDKAVMRNAKGLRFLVLDELHTYRGRQGADVALLVRRVREALADKLICIGTSATMATEGTQMERNAVVAKVARRLFGTAIPDRNIITETLRRTTPESQTDVSVAPQLADAIRAGVPMALSFDDMAKHPVSIWVELTLGLSYEGLKPRRARPKTLRQASQLLAKASGLDDETCRAYLQQFLLRAYDVTDARTKRSLPSSCTSSSPAAARSTPRSRPPASVPSHWKASSSLPAIEPGTSTTSTSAATAGRSTSPSGTPTEQKAAHSSVATSKNASTRMRDVKFGFLMPDAEGLWDSTATWSATQRLGSKSAPMASGASSRPTASSCRRR